MTTDKNTARLLKQAKERVAREWGHGFEKLGSRIQRALLAEEVLFLAAGQDEDDVPDATVRRIISEGWIWVLNETGY